MSSSVSDLFRTWLQRQLGLSSSVAASSSISDLENLLYAQSGIASNRVFKFGEYSPVDVYGTTSTAALTVNNLVLMPFIVGIRNAFTSIGFENVTAGTAGSVVRGGIYNTGSDGKPNALLAFSSAIATDVGTGTGIDLPIQVTLDPGLYWVAMVPQVASPTFRIITNFTQPYVSTATIPINNPASLYFQSGVSGALPATVTLSGVTTAAIRAVVKAG